MSKSSQLLYPELVMTTTEMVELANKINEPVIQKYLTHLALNCIKELNHATRKEGESAESFLERIAEVRGGLSSIETLLDIEKPAQAVKP
jgi:hypothetical protein